jgi:hypothetical protein
MALRDISLVRKPQFARHYVFTEPRPEADIRGLPHILLLSSFAFLIEKLSGPDLHELNSRRHAEFDDRRRQSYSYVVGVLFEISAKGSL